VTTAPRFTVPRDDRRECALYRIRVLDPRTNYKTVTLGYIGETGRMPFTRFMEHLYDQPWGDTIVGHPEVDPRVFSGKAEVLAAEEEAVKAERPLYNIEWQKGAPHQIPQWTAREQREARDRAKGLRSPDWAVKGTAPQPRQTPATRPTPPRPARTSRLTPKWRRRLLKTAAFPVATLVLWLALVLYAAPRIAGDRWQLWPVLALAVVAEAFALPLVRRVRKRDRGLATLGITAAVAMLAGALYDWTTGT
jgi:hypothetical protein